MALSGQINMGHSAMMSIGAYVSGMLAKYLEWSPWFTIIIGALAKALYAARATLMYDEQSQESIISLKL